MSLSPNPTQATRDRMEEVMAVIEAKVAAGERDLMEGGVSSVAIAGELGISDGLAGEDLRRLMNQDDVARVRGVNPETLEPRPSYLPAARPDASTPEPAHAHPSTGGDL